MKERVYSKKREFELAYYMKCIYSNRPTTMEDEQAVVDLFLGIYERTKYPGAYYRIAVLYELEFFNYLKENKMMEYLEKAANEGYIAARNRLAKYKCIDNQGENKDNNG